MRRRPRGVVITGTDTGVGKTLVSAGLAAWCRRAHLDVGVMKPVATGGVREPGGGRRWISADVELLAMAAGVRDDWTLLNPICYREPLAPYTAAQRAGRPVELSRVVVAFRRLAASHAFMIVEGVGGLLVPLSRRRTVADLIRALDLPCIIVARVRLGTLNHTLLTVRQAQQEGLRVVGVILNGADGPPARAGLLAQRTNPAVLRTLLPVPLLGVLPYRRTLAEGRPSAATLARWIQSGLDPTFLHWMRRRV